MIEKVVKRSGLTDDYDTDKILGVILKATDNAGYTIENGNLNGNVLSDINDIVGEVDDSIQENYKDASIPVDVIQEIIIDKLLDSDYKDIAKSFIDYSSRRKQEREDMMNTEKAVQRVLKADPQVVNENGNKDSRKLITKRDLISGQVFRAKGLAMLPQDIREAHLKGDIHWHKQNCAV